MNLKQRVFIDIMNQVPFGSNKMTGRDNVVGVYTEELIQDKESEPYTRAVEKVSKEYPSRDWLFNWFVDSELIHQASKEVHEARNWLIKEGYIREFVREVGTRRYFYHGLTKKGWKVAPLYKKLEKQSETKEETK